MKTHKDLHVFNGSMDLTKVIYKLTLNFPKEEVFSLTNQIRRAAVSVPANISEGAGRRNVKEYKYFLRISSGS
ncbi:MAG: four helix bundle protein [Bacteroidales bacterium]|nr:four helix bundle protein [Bacteroidales bacterium]